MQGDYITRDVYIKPPPEASCNENVVWKFKKKCVYGLADASLKWYERIKKFVFNNNGEVSHLDPALFGKMKMICTVLLLYMSMTFFMQEMTFLIKML